jgi:2-polyprenyl-3-methyl-5-hydroxy-6-metoxy-1,4-benzoquinol methylase
MRDPVFELLACDRCGHVYSSRILRSDVLAHEYYGESDADLAERSLSAKEDRLREYEAMLRAAAMPCGRVLDVGCNAGDLLMLFRQRGWSVAGVEIAPGPAEFARKERGIQVWTGTIHALPVEEKFDLITMTHVLEHIPEPAPFLARVRAALAPGGLLLVEVPNVRDPLLRVWGRHYRPLCLGDHVSFFSPASLRGILERSSFRVVQEASPTHARDLLYASLLSAVDAVRSMPRSGAAAERGPVGVEAATRYRGALRAPLRKVLDGVTRAADPAVVFATRSLSRTGRGTCLIHLARAA